MILVVLGTQDKQFTRLLDDVSREIELGHIKDEVIVQAGQTKYSSDKIESWSSWDESKYTSFQNSLKDQIQSNRPLDWEYNAWIEIAKSRKK